MSINPLFKVVSDRTAKPVDNQESFAITTDGTLIDNLNANKDYMTSRTHLHVIFPHEERLMEFKRKEGERTEDYYTRLFPIGTKVWLEVDDGQWIIVTVTSWTTGLLNGMIFCKRDFDMNRHSLPPQN